MNPKASWIIVGVSLFLLVIDFSGILIFGKITKFLLIICLSFFLIERLLRFFVIAGIKSNINKLFRDTLTTLTLVDEFIEYSEEQSEFHAYKYSVVQKVVMNKDCYYVFIAEKKALLIPMQAFANDVERKVFFDIILEKSGAKFEVALNIQY